MARRRKTAPVEDLIDVVALMPWWVGVALAVVGYLWLHHVATQPLVIAPGSPGAITAVVWRGFATAGQYLVPLVGLLGALVSFLRQRKRKELVDNVVQSDASDALHGMSWREFEVLVAEGFRLQGFEVEETGGGGADGGIDLVLSRPGRTGREKFLVQCKQWRSFKVGVTVVRELYGVMAARGAAGGFVVTSGRFTEEAVSFASGRNVMLVDGPKLHGLIRQAKAGAHHSPGQAAEAPPMRATAPPVRPATPPVQHTAAPLETVSCPLCSKPMVRRTAKRGANAGMDFWGCTGYPACRGTRPIP